MGHVTGQSVGQVIGQWVKSWDNKKVSGQVIKGEWVKSWDNKVSRYIYVPTGIVQGTGR